MVEQCYAKKKTTINPIVDWEDEDVWEFLNDVAKVPHCELYDQGFTRLGCIGCPLSGRDNMLKDFERWPRYKELYIKAFDEMIKNHPGEIKVANGELVENSTRGGYSDIHRMGRLERLTAPSSDLSKRPSNQALSPQERERENGDAVLQSVAPVRPTHPPHTHTHTRRSDTPMVDVDAATVIGTGRAKPNYQTHMTRPLSTTNGGNMGGVERRALDHNQLTGEKFLTYWLWRCRSDQNDWSVHPLRQYDPKSETYDGSLIQTQE